MKRHPEILTAALLVLAVFAGAIQSEHFLDFPYLLDTTTLYVETGLAALGMTLIIVSGNIDLSIGSQVALVACLTALMTETGLPTPVAVMGGVVSGVLLGAFNGALVAFLKMPSVVVTLATMALYRGTAQALLSARSIPLPETLIGIDRYYFAGLPVPLIILAAASIVTAITLQKTVLGRWIYVTGTNETAAFFSGVPTARVKLWVFALAGLLAGVAGVLIDSRLGVARYDHARGLELEAITAVVLGGASIFGGSGSIIGSLLALALIAVVRTGMGLANIKAEYQLAVVGTLLVFSVVANNILVRRPAKKCYPRQKNDT